MAAYPTERSTLPAGDSNSPPEEAIREQLANMLASMLASPELNGRPMLRGDSLIALQEEIARIVTARVGSEYESIPRTLSRESRKKPPESLETYEALLHFCHYVTLLTPEAFSQALCVLDHAVARGQLERKREAEAAIAELLKLRHDFPSKGTWLIGCYVKFE